MDPASLKCSSPSLLRKTLKYLLPHLLIWSFKFNSLFITFWVVLILFGCWQSVNIDILQNWQSECCWLLCFVFLTFTVQVRGFPSKNSGCLLSRLGVTVSLSKRCLQFGIRSSLNCASAMVLASLRCWLATDDTARVIVKATGRILGVMAKCLWF